MKNLISIAIITLFVSCNDIATVETIQIEYNDATFLAELETDLYQNIYIIDSNVFGISRNRDRVEIFDNDSEFKQTWGSTGYGPGEFIKIGSVTNSSNRLFFHDSVKKSVEIFDKDFNYIITIPLESNLLSIVAESDSSFFASDFTMTQFSVVRFSGTNFSNIEYLYVESTRNPEDGMAHLSLYNNHLLVSRLMSNKLNIINTKTKERVNVTNDYIPSQPNYSYVGEYRVPTKVIWDWGIISENSVYQLIRERQSSTIYRFGLDGKMNKIFSLDFQAMRMIDYNDSYLFVTPNSLITYPKSIF